MDEKKFVNLITDLVVDEEVAPRVIAGTAPADRCIIVFFTPRSGSSWLTKIARNTNRLGHLEEYLNPDFIVNVAKRMHATDAATLLEMLKRWACTPNGVFSIEARAVDVKLLGEAEFFAAFAAPVVFFLWRDNLVAQAISLARAVATGRFHSVDASPAPPPEYDPAQIAFWMRHIVHIENSNLALLTRHRLAARFLRYEDIVRDRGMTLRIISDAIRIDLSPEDSEAHREGDLQKIGDDWNRHAERRFRAEQRDLIWDFEAQRAMRSVEA